MEFITNDGEILKCLKESWIQGKAIGIFAPAALGHATFVTSVEKIENLMNEVIVHLKEYDNTGYILPRKKLLLSEISKVCEFNSTLSNPYLKNLTEKRSEHDRNHS